jgi:uncharacterized Zn finger protein
MEQRETIEIAHQRLAIPCKYSVYVYFRCAEFMETNPLKLRGTQERQLIWCRYAGALTLAAYRSFGID